MEESGIEQILVSVILPVYNAEHFVQEAIQSILDQSYTRIELIVVNDGSNDSSENIIRAFQDPRLVYFKNEYNIGLIASLNKALQLARGELIARMDADDIAMKNRFEVQVNMFRSDPELLLAGSSYFILRGRQKRKLQAHENNDYLKANLLFSTSFCHPSIMMRRPKGSDLVYESAFKHAEDYRLWTRLVPYGKFSNAKEALLVYRDNPGQWSNRFRQEQFEISARIRREYAQTLGFSFSEAQFSTLNHLGNNTRMREWRQLQEAEALLQEIVKQNHNLKVFGNLGFRDLIQKQWLDACGNTTLGLKAFRACLRSDLSKGANPYQVSKLLLKCLLRKRFD
ncbi:MAG TPA: glycosyltransferase family 2 protein [Bacteroidia bacterium]|nr:glycosyltransferase family 2 protein [Bacteroidia bacterium]